MRCLTLADGARQRGVHTRFVSRYLPDHFIRLLADRGHEHRALPRREGKEATGAPTSEGWLGTTEITDADHSTRALSDRRWDWVVVDHYVLSAVWERAIRRVAARVMVIDDLADRAHDCDVLLDQNLYVESTKRYLDRVPAACRLLLGPKYALLRDEFRSRHEQASVRDGSVKCALVCFGGTDIANDTARAVDALADCSDGSFRVDVVIGESHPFRPEIEAACLTHRFRCHVGPTDLAALMANADVAVGAGGSAVWERCCVGLPALVFSIADNQRKQVRDAAAAGLICAPDAQSGDDRSALIARHFRALLENSALRFALSRAALAAVDGRGVSRVLRYLEADGIEIRAAVRDDCWSLFEWRNHPTIRAVSRRHEPIDWPDHVRWFDAQQADPNRLLLIGERAGTPVGVVRFDIVDAGAEVSIYLVPGGQTAGTGGPLLDAAERWLAGARPDVTMCRAQVLGTNDVSHRLFSSAGYSLESAWYWKRLNQWPDSR